EQPEPVLLVQQNLQGEGAGTPGREFDGQRQPVEASAQLEHRLLVLESQAQRRVQRGCPLDEQPGGFVPLRLAFADSSAGRRQGQGRNRVERFAVNTQRFATGGQHVQVRAATQQVGG